MRLEALVDEIEAQLQQRSLREVASREIGELVLVHLQKLSEVAYVRFASVYQQFQGIRDFVEALNHLKESGDPPASANDLTDAARGSDRLSSQKKGIDKLRLF